MSVTLPRPEVIAAAQGLQEGPQAGPPTPVLFVGLKPLRRRFHAISMEMPLGPDSTARPRSIGKPGGGLWTCREWPELPRYSAWSDHSVAQSRSGHRSALWRLVAPSPKLLTIDSAADIQATFDRYPSDFLAALELRAQLPHEPWDQYRFPELDHKAIEADGYDGVEITPRGLASRFDTSFGWSDWIGLAFSGWDVPTILWYRWVFQGAPERVDAYHA